MTDPAHPAVPAGSAARLISTAAVACLWLVALAEPACGESEYEFGMALVKQFGFDDLAEKRFTRLKSEGTPDERISGTLGLGAIRKAQADQMARAGSDPKRTDELYDEATALIEEFLRSARGDHPELPAAMGLKAEIGEQRIKVVVELARTATDAAEKASQRAKALQMYKEITDPMGEAAEKARKRFWDAYVPWEERNKNENARLPAEIMKLLEAAVDTHQRYFRAMLAQAEVYEKDSDQLKSFVTDLVEKMEKDKERYDSVGLPLVVHWLSYALGRAHVYAGEKDKAYEEFSGPIGEDGENFPRGEILDFVDRLRIETFYLKAKAALDWKDYSAVIETVGLFYMPPRMGYLGALDTDQGNAITLMRARALTMKAPADLDAAKEDCLRVIAKGYDGWPNNARELLNEIVGGSVKNAKEEMLLDPRSIFEAALGAVGKGQNDEAVGLFRRAIIACRAKDATPYRERLQYEPQAWFEMGVTFARQELWYEAGFAFEAVLRNFAKDIVGRDLAEHPDFEDLYKRVKENIRKGVYKQEEGAVLDEYSLLFDEAAMKSPLKGILTALDERLKKSAQNLMYVARRCERESGWDFDSDLYHEAMKTLIMVDPARKKFLDYYLAAFMNEKAENLRQRKKMVEAVETTAQAGELFGKAGDTQQDIREIAYHMSGKSYYRAMTEARGLAESNSGLAARANEYGKLALEAFDKFDAYIARTPAGAPEQVAAREKRAGQVALARPVIMMDLGRYRDAVAAADAFLASEPGDEKSVRSITMTRFKAMAEMTALAIGTRDEAKALHDLTAACEALKTGPAKEFYGAACSMISATYNKAVAKLQELAAANPARRDELNKQAEAYQLVSAEWSDKMIEHDPAKVQEFGFMLRTADIFFKQKAYAGAAKKYREIIKAHDPDGDGKKVELAAGSFASAAAPGGGVNIEREDVLRKVRKEVASLEEMIFGEPEKDRPKSWKKINGKWEKVQLPKKQNWKRAYSTLCDLLDLLGQYKDVQCKDLLERARNELAFRLQMLSVRLNLADCDRELARQNPEQAQELLTEALANLQKVRDYYWRDNDLCFEQAKVHEALGQLEDAREQYDEVKNHRQENTDGWYEAGAMYSRVAFKQAENEEALKKERAEAYQKRPGQLRKDREDLYRKAMAFPDALVRLVPEAEWKKHFPDVREFIANCEAGIKGLGVDVTSGAPIDETAVDYAATSDDDSNLLREFKNIKERIEQNLVKAEERKKLQREVMIAHFGTLLRQSREKVGYWVQSKQIKPSQADAKLKELLAQIIYQSPFGLKALRELAVHLDVMSRPDEGIPIQYLSKEDKELCIRLGLLTPEGDKKPISEIPEELLRTEVPELGSARGAAVEAPEGTAEEVAP